MNYHSVRERFRMKKTRHSADFKAKVALEAIRELKTAGEIASGHGVHPVQVSQWKKIAIDGIVEAFSSSAAGKANSKAYELEKDALFQQIGQLKYELDWVKKKSGIRP
jgi:transposase-like protein